MSLKVSKGTLIRTIILAVAIINNLLALFGKSPLPIEDETIEEVISFLFTTGTAIAAWWKNNSFTDAALKADAVLRQLKEE